MILARAAQPPQISPIWSSKPPATTDHVELGNVRVQWGLEQCESWWSTNLLRTGAAVGAAEGYATFKDAVSDLSKLTEDDAGPAALVLREGDRFYGRTLETFTVSGYERDGVPGEWHTINEIPENYDIMDVRRGVVDPRLAGIVDGYLIHRFVEHPRTAAD